MKIIVMLMLRCALIMHLSSFLQNGTLATLEELKALQKWETSCLTTFIKVTLAVREEPLDDPNDIPEIKQTLKDLLDKVKDFPLKKETEELLKRRLEKPLQIAISNCDKLEEEHKKVKNSELEDNKNYLETLLSKIRSFEAGYAKEMNTFLFEVGLELIKQYLLDLLRNDESYCDNNSSAWLLAQAKNPSQNQKEFVENIENFIVHTKLSILENELSAKIAEFEEQQQQKLTPLGETEQAPHIDGDGFMGFSDEFKVEWNKIEQKIVETKIDNIKMDLQINTQKFADIKTYRERLDDLAKNAMKETAPLKGIITKKLDELVTKCHNDGLNAMKDVISEIGMFDCAANKLLVRFEHEELDNTDFCAELEKAVEQNNKMVSTAYQVKKKKSKLSKFCSKIGQKLQFGR
uniref:Uncharacterized protein n=1 Tax=Globodera rostochiensis TaxID=31243 RepID=A0A914H009_GLORO